MPIYAKKINGAQRRMLKTYASICGFEPMHQDELDSGEMTFNEVWRSNVDWLENVVADVQNICVPGALKFEAFTSKPEGE